MGLQFYYQQSQSLDMNSIEHAWALDRSLYKKLLQLLHFNLGRNSPVEDCSDCHFCLIEQSCSKIPSESWPSINGCIHYIIFPQMLIYWLSLVTKFGGYLLLTCLSSFSLLYIVIPTLRLFLIFIPWLLTKWHKLELKKKSLQDFQQKVTLLIYATKCKKRFESWNDGKK